MPFPLLPCYPSAHPALRAAFEDRPVASFATIAGKRALRATTSFVALTNALGFGVILALPLLLLSRP